MAIVVDFDPKRERPQAPCPCPFCTAVRRSNRQHPSSKERGK